MVRYGKTCKLSYTEEIAWFGGLKSGPVPPAIEPTHPGVLIVISLYTGV